MTDNNLEIVARDLKDYGEAIDDIGKIINKKQFTYIEAFGLLEAVKVELILIEAKNDRKK